MGIPVEIVGEGIDWPAWVQAVGSVLAIFASALVAIAVQRMSDRAHRDRVAIAEAQHYAASRGAIVYLQRTLARIRSQIEAADGDSAAFKTYHPKQWLADAVQVLKYYQGREHTSPDLVVALFNAENELDNLATALRAHRGSGGSFHQCDGWLKHAEDNVDGVLKRLDTTDV